MDTETGVKTVIEGTGFELSFSQDETAADDAVEAYNAEAGRYNYCIFSHLDAETEEWTVVAFIGTKDILRQSFSTKSEAFLYCQGFHCGYIEALA